MKLRAKVKLPGQMDAEPSTTKDSSRGVLLQSELGWSSQ